ncbi:isochorismatase family protein [Cytobacillus kochii]|uniref:isochorismatase family protein n=1 Tax=Cytobacillus kochii TaxID=859143 RepID=UPI0020405042|nr:isochorismatase family protein [Cytobacillus kochii]MCM3321374.1 isochorismatase family protein [Cytobacillus kochii]MCM3343792.1 isochorismatase family protein [Cytobacillus kochii]
MTRPWEDMLTEVDRMVIQKGGYGKKRGLGKKPALVIIDIQHNYVGANLPIADQLETWPSGGGAKAWEAIEKIKKMKKLSDQLNIPTIYTRNVQKKTINFDSFAVKAERDNSKYIDGRPEAQIVSELEPESKDLVVDKSYASAFFGTPLISYLVKMGVDTLIIVGGSTSGCVRATAVDAVTHNFNVAVVEDCVYDRIELSHKAGLLDLWMKYCDVSPSEEIYDYLKQFQEGGVKVEG